MVQAPPKAFSIGVFITRCKCCIETSEFATQCSIVESLSMLRLYKHDKINEHSTIQKTWGNFEEKKPKHINYNQLRQITVNTARQQ